MTEKKLIRWCLAGFILLQLGGCSRQSQSPPQTSASGASQAGEVYQVPINSRGWTVEQQNIQDRIRVTTDPTKVMWIHLIALDGKIIRRMPVRNKVTSSGKRLEPTQAAPYESGYPQAGDANGSRTMELIQPDACFGSSDPYIFWFDPMGRYHQCGTAGGIGYLLTDYPIDLENPIDSMTGLYNVQKQAAEWQKEQEKRLVEQEAQFKKDNTK